MKLEKAISKRSDIVLPLCAACMTAFVAVISTPCDAAVGESLSMDLTLNAERSELWAVLGNEGSYTVPIQWPADAARATLTVENSAGGSTDIAIGSTATDSVAVPLSVPASDADEMVYTLTLRFYTSADDELAMERKSARLAAVRGVNGRTAASSHGVAVSERTWNQFRAKVPVVHVPTNAAAMSVSGPVGSASIDLAQYPACRYAVFSAGKSGVYALGLFDAEETAVASASVERIPVGVVMVVR